MMNTRFGNTALIIATAGLLSLVISASADADPSPASAVAPSAVQPQPEPTASSKPSAPDDVQKAKNMPEGADRLAALVAAIKTWTLTNPIDAENWAAQQDKTLQRPLLDATSTVWLDHDEKAALDWAMNHGNGIQQHFMFGNYGGRHGQAGADWVLQQPNHNSSELGVTVEAWCGHNKDNQKTTEAAGAWVLQQQLSKDDAVAVIHFVAAAKAWNNPPEAADWVLKLPVNLPREESAETVAAIWSRKIPADNPKIKDWINQLPFTDDKKAEVTKAIVVK